MTIGTHRSEFVYDGLQRRVQQVEKENGVVQSDTRVLWCRQWPCQRRDSTGTVVTRSFFTFGFREGQQSFFYTLDHLGSVTEVTDSTGQLKARTSYDPYGRATTIVGDVTSRLAFAELAPAPAGLLDGVFRAYDPNLGRWLNQDPIGLEGGVDLYSGLPGVG